MLWLSNLAAPPSTAFHFPRIYISFSIFFSLLKGEPKWPQSRSVTWPICISLGRRAVPPSPFKMPQSPTLFPVFALQHHSCSAQNASHYCFTLSVHLSYWYRLDLEPQSLYDLLPLPSRRSQGQNLPKTPPL